MSESSRSPLSPSPGPNNNAPSSSPSPSRTAKRKRNTGDDQEATPIKPAKRKKAKKAKPDEDENLDLKQGLNLAIGKLDSRLQADYVAQRTKRFSSDLSLVELEDRHIPGKCVMTMSEVKCYNSRRILNVGQKRHSVIQANGRG